MLGWLRKKINKKIENEMGGCILQNLKFVEFYNNQDKLNPSLDLFIEEIERVSKFMKNKLDLGEFLTSEDNSKLLDVNMNCRRIWANEFGGSDFKFDKQFSIK
jgi:hypothetical protein